MRRKRAAPAVPAGGVERRRRRPRELEPHRDPPDLVAVTDAAVPTTAKRGHALLRWTFVAAAAVDLVLGITALAAWPRLLRAAGIALPADPIFVQLAALMTIGAALAFLAGGWNGKSPAIVGVAVIVRAASAVLLATFISRGLLPLPFITLVAAELLLAVLHFSYARCLVAETE